MKNIFVLDECFVRCVSQSRNERGEFDTSFGLLYYLIAYNCHKIALTECLYRKYSIKVDEIKLERQIPRTDIFFHLLQNFMINSDKVIWGPDIQIDFPLDSFDEDDNQIVSLASRKNAILVTTDDKLIKDLNTSNIITRHNFEVKRPENAIADAQ